MVIDPTSAGQAAELTVHADKFSGENKSSWYAPVTEFASGIISSALQYKMAKDAQRFSERMANTAHQREVEDMKRAGINPILSVTGGSGAAAPEGIVADIGNPGKGLAQNLLDTAMQKEQIELVRAQVRLTSAQEAKVYEEKENAVKSNDWIEAQTRDASARAVTSEENNKRLRELAKLYETKFGKKLPWLQAIIDALSPLK